MTERTHPLLGLVTISPMQEAELPLVMSSWMHSSDWRRAQMAAVIADGTVLVARDDGGLALGWLAVDVAGRIVHGYVKSSYRGLGLMRMLWESAGSPVEIVDAPGNKRISRVLKRLIGEE